MLTRDGTILVVEGAEKSTRFADQVRAERESTASKALDVVSAQVVTSILTHSSREQAAAVLDMLNDSGEMTISTACMVAGQLLANIVRRVEAQHVSSYLGGIVRLALDILAGDRELAELAAATPAGAA